MGLKANHPNKRLKDLDFDKVLPRLPIYPHSRVSFRDFKLKHKVSRKSVYFDKFAFQKQPNLI